MRYRSETHRKLDQWGAGLLGLFAIASSLIGIVVAIWQAGAWVVSLVS